MKAFWKDIFREIKNTRGRFLSLVIITVLGAASVVGIQATVIDMQNIADEQYKEHQLYDIQLKSTVGFNEGDVAALRDTAGVSEVLPTMIYDTYIAIDDEDRVVRAYALPDTMNTVDVLEGRLPVSASECVVEYRMLKDGAYKIGDEIKLKLDNMDDYFQVFHGDTFEIVGVVSSPLYVSAMRGNSALGNGSLHYYLYLHPDAFALEIYTDIYVRMDGSQTLYSLSETYDQAADGWKSKVERTGNVRCQWKADELYDAQRKIDEGWDEYNSGVRELDEKSAESLQQLAEAKMELDNAKAELENGQKLLDEKSVEGQKEIDRNAKNIKDNQAAIDAQRAELDYSQAQIDAARRDMNNTMAQLSATGNPGDSPEWDALYDQTYEGLRQLDEKQHVLDAGKNNLAAAQARLDDGAKQISNGQSVLDAERAQAQAQIDSGWAVYNKGLESYNEGISVFNTERANALKKLDDAKRELEDAQEKLNDAPKPEWFYFTRKDGVAFDSYYQDTLRLQKIGYVFPMVFFLVAILVSLTSMSRMVEEYRTQIGIYKAMGYHPAAIMMKYFVYAFSASLIGGIIGVFLGSNLFPRVISEAYGHLYNLPPVATPIPPLLGLLAIVIAVASVVAVTIGTCARAMAGAPAQLLRPKAPPIGKRVLIEKISFLWNRLSFIGKVTARNIFRYKKRFVMTLIGVAGCSALLLTAFGLRDSLSGVAQLQYEEIISYDAHVYLKEITTDDQRAEVDVAISGKYLYVREESIDASGKNGDASAALIVPERSEDLSQFIHLYSPDSGEPMPLPSDGVFVTEKLARMMGIAVGDNFTLTAGGGKTYTVQATGIVENYVLHYIYMSPAVYSDLFGTDAKSNGIFAITDDAETFAETMMQNGNVRAVIGTADLLASLGDSTDAMSIVTVVLIVLACALALVVLFNLTNINISERMRELATLKVLGFQEEETAMYIYRENTGVTIMGILLGLAAGIFLHRFILLSVEIDLLKFPHMINLLSYIGTVALSFVFALFVNWVMHFKLAKIDMVESLKSVE